MGLKIFPKKKEKKKDMKTIARIITIEGKMIEGKGWTRTAVLDHLGNGLLIMKEFMKNKVIGFLAIVRDTCTVG